MFLKKVKQYRLRKFTPKCNAKFAKVSSNLKFWLHQRGAFFQIKHTWKVTYSTDQPCNAFARRKFVLCRTIIRTRKTYQLHSSSSLVLNKPFAAINIAGPKQGVLYWKLHTATNLPILPKSRSIEHYLGCGGCCCCKWTRGGAAILGDCAWTTWPERCKWLPLFRPSPLKEELLTRLLLSLEQHPLLGTELKHRLCRRRPVDESVDRATRLL